ncbi:hypothetical protein [Archangium sp.]|jgi:hypothetical protein
MPAQGRNPALAREKAPPLMDGGRSFGTRGVAERPPSIRETIIRWLNEEL